MRYYFHKSSYGLSTEKAIRHIFADLVTYIICDHEAVCSLMSSILIILSVRSMQMTTELVLCYFSSY